MKAIDQRTPEVYPTGALHGIRITAADEIGMSRN